MSRSRSFVAASEPLRHEHSLQIQNQHTHGPFSFLNPIQTRFRHKALSYDTAISSGTPRGAVISSSSDEEKASQANTQPLISNVEYRWRSRDNRKGRHAIVVAPSSDSSNAQHDAPACTDSMQEAWNGIVRMTTTYPIWDVSYLVAIIFTLGSVVWVVNAFFVWLPLVRPATEFRNEILYGGGISAFVGATIFEVGSVLLMIEAVNENRSGCFGWALEQVMAREKGENKVRFRPNRDGCAHHHAWRDNLVGHIDAKGPNASSSSTSLDISANAGPFKPSSTSNGTRVWIWFPSMHDLTSHYLRELGFLASFAQFLGATIFWISGFTALPGIINHMSQGLLDGVYWVPQIVGGTGFIISSALFMLETQSKWYIPAPKVLGWHIGLWNLIGALGFTLCGALGPAYGNSGAQFEASLATFWGSWGFLIGSMIQWYESLDKYPVEKRAKDE